MRKMPILDGLRGFAALTVLIGHGEAIFIKSGWIDGIGQQGVALFFMLSAFLLTTIYAPRPFNLGEVWKYIWNRVARVLPLFYLAVPVFAVLYELSAWNIAVLFTFASAEWSLWTIPVEVHFYALFLLIWHDISRGNGWRSIIVIGAAMLMVAALMLHVGPDTGRLPMWCHYFLIGTSFALVMLQHPHVIDRMRKSNRAWGWCALALFTFSVPGVRIAIGLPVMPNYADPVLALGVASLFCASYLAIGPARLFCAAPFRFFGGISYGVYVIHWPILVIMDRAGFRGWFPLVTYAAASTIIAIASLRFFERPAHRFLSRLSNAKMPASILG